jgi:hypothetical protein
MKKVTIKNKLGVAGWGAEMADPTAWIAEGIAGNWWGKPERWVLHKDEPMAESYDEVDVLEEEIRDTIDGVAQKWVKLKAEYSIEIEDITAQVAQEAINSEALAYLASTDWLVIREVDAGVPCPADIKVLRAEARAKIVR